MRGNARGKRAGLAAGLARLRAKILRLRRKPASAPPSISTILEISTLTFQHCARYT